MSFNQSVFQAIYGLSHRNFFFDDLGVFLAQYLPYLLVIAFLILIYYEDGWRRRFYLFIEGTMAVIISRGLLTEVIRFFYHHPRPFDALGFTPLIAESGSSFPSGHMTFFFALAIVVWYVNRRWGVWFLFASALVGVARIYVGVHWPLDILGGAAIGILSAMFIHWLLRDARRGLVTPKTSN